MTVSKWWLLRPWVVGAGIGLLFMGAAWLSYLHSVRLWLPAHNGHSQLWVWESIPIGGVVMIVSYAFVLFRLGIARPKPLYTPSA